MRPITATISQSALKHNLSIIKSHAQNAKVLAVVKANAYGHGLFNVAQALDEADGFGVLGLNEAIDLREAGFNQVILLLEGVFSAAELNIATSYSVEVTVHNIHQLEMLEHASLIAPINVHLKMNSGMNRLGFKSNDYLEAFNRLKKCKNVDNITLMTHFATADALNGVEHPYQVFKNTTLHLDNKKSLANSAAILLHPKTHADWVRPGIILYGASPITGALPSKFDLVPVMQFTSEIIAVQHLAAGDGLGYGQSFIADKAMRIGVVACGYADGYPRHANTGTPIAVNGKKTQTLGRVSMDMLCCDLTDIPDANVGSKVELWGNQIPVDTVAEACGTIGYELLCAITPRVMMMVIA
jgi:alanine racemase